MFRNNSRKQGFTLAELLIVVAIIAVLVAVAIPVFTAQLEKAKVATTVANLRAGYAEAQARAMLGDYDDINNGNFTIYIDDLTIPLTQEQLQKYRDELEDQLSAVGITEVAWDNLPTDTNVRTVTYFGMEPKVDCLEIDPLKYYE